MYHNSCHRNASHCLSVTKSTFCGGFKAKSKTGVRLFTLQFPARTCAHAQVCLLIPVLDKHSLMQKVLNLMRWKECAATWKTRRNEAGMPATGSQALITACIPTQREGTADHSPDNPISCCSTVSDSSFINSDKSCSLSPSLGKQKSFPKHLKLTVSDFSCRDPAVIQGTTASDEKDDLWCLLPQ